MALKKVTKWLRRVRKARKAVPTGKNARYGKRAKVAKRS